MTESTNPGAKNEDDLIEEFIEREQSPHRDPLVRITGLTVQYYHVCTRELWVFLAGPRHRPRRGEHPARHPHRRDELPRQAQIVPD